MPEQRVNILVYRSDSTLVAQYLLGDGEHLIGRDINCPIYLDSEYISSNHAKLHLSHDGILIEDLNSTSGTFLDGVTVRGKLRIKPGQLLQVGDLTVHLQPESEGQIGPGSRLGDGRYTLIRMLGRGGMGEVWLAKDEQLDEEVALKKLPPEVGADAMALADMRREVQKSRALSHPNIIRIHDLIQKSGEDPVISLEFVDGTDLTAIAATKTNGIFGWEEIKDWTLQLVSALEYAHEEKIVHRDLKPGNIMISRNGRLKLADFGIAATLVDSLSRSSIEGFVSGTTLYMSPQQMEGAAPKATDDIYAFGATLYELLTGKPPFYTGNVEHQVLQVTPMPLSQRLAEFGFVSEIPPYVNELVMACLAKNPEGRPQTMTAIRDWIQSEGTAKETIPKPSTKTYKKRATEAVAQPEVVATPEVEAQQGGSKNRMAYAIGAGVILVCLVIGMIMARSDKPNGPNPNEAGAAKDVFTSAGDVGEGPAWPAPTIMRYDQNKDGKISRTEVPIQMSRLFDMADKNKDGFLDQTEMQRFPVRQPIRQPGRVPNSRAVSLTKGLVAYYPFNGDAKDESGKGRHGTIKSPARGYVTGKLGSGIAMTPSTSIALPLGHFQECTVSMWVKPDFLGEKYAHLLSTHGHVPDYLTVNFGVREEGYPYASINIGPFNWITTDLLRSVKFPQKQWNHVAFSWGRPGLHLYLNGQLIAVGKKLPPSVKLPILPNHFPGPPIAPVRLNKNTKEWRLGALARRSDNAGLACVMDEVRIHDRVLTEAEIKALYDLEKSGIQPAAPPGTNAPAIVPAPVPVPAPATAP